MLAPVVPAGTSGWRNLRLVDARHRQAEGGFGWSVAALQLEELLHGGAELALDTSLWSLVV